MHPIPTDSNIHLSPDCVRFFGKDVLEISELNSNQIIGNLYIAYRKRIKSR